MIEATRRSEPEMPWLRLVLQDDPACTAGPPSATSSANVSDAHYLD
jgi:hypothetical protein